jgi:hypothetical protein
LLQAGTTNSRGTSSALCGNSKVRLLRSSGPPRARIRTYSKRLSIARTAHPSSEEIAASTPSQTCHSEERRRASRSEVPAESKDHYTLSAARRHRGIFPCCLSLELPSEKVVTAEVEYPLPLVSWNQGVRRRFPSRRLKPWDFWLRSLMTNDLASVSLYLVVKPAGSIDTFRP